MTRRIDVEAVTFRAAGEPGDFGWMRDQPEYARALFLFNDNESQFEAYQRGDRDAGCAPGAGNGRYRPWQCEDPPRAAGVPTGAGGGYRALDDHTRAVIDRALAHVRRVLHDGDYDRVVYSCEDGDAALLGSGTFRPADDVLRYIPAELRRIVAELDGTPEG